MTRLLLALLLLALGTLAAKASWHDRDFACDDAYITFRYAENLRDGHGLRWNPDSPPCEGYTNLSYVVLLAALSSLGIEPRDGAQGLAIASVFCLLLIAWVATRSAGRWQPLALTPILTWFAAPDLQVHMSRGLETVWFGLLVVCQAAAMARLGSAPAATMRTALGAAGCGIALFLTRPDGVLASSCGWVVLAIAARRDPARLRLVGKAGGVWLLAGGIYALGKLAVFGYVLPNSYYMKSGGGRFAGIAETMAFVADYRWLLLLAVVGWLAARLPRGSVGGATRVCTSIALAVAVPWLAYAAKVVHEIGFSHRFAWPLVPLLGFGAASGLTAAASHWQQGRLARGWPLSWLVLAGALALAYPQQRAWFDAMHAPRGTDPYTSMFLRVGKAIHATGYASELTLYCTHAGATPYAAKAHHVDRAGLVDNGYCPRTPPEERARYEAELKLDIVLWHHFPASAGAARFDDDPRAKASRYLNQWCLGTDPDMDVHQRQAQEQMQLEARKSEAFGYMTLLRDHATLVGEMRTGLQRWREFVYVWKTSTRHDELVAHLAQHVDVPATAVDFDGWPQ